jgi:hypothetical protein
MPTCHRPEFLALSLEKLAKTPEYNELDVRIFLDVSSEERLVEVDFVRDTYFPSATIFHANPHIYAPSGSWNILQSLKAGYESGAELVYLVEEDVMVSSGNFFQTHQYMQSTGDYFVTCGRRLMRLSEDYYTNPGSCYRREKLALVMPHICDEYFSDQRAYITEHFEPMDDAGILDDGLIRRVMMSVGGKAKCAVPSIAAHQGFHFYGRFVQYKTYGAIEDRIIQLRDMLSGLDSTGRYTKDFEV